MPIYVVSMKAWFVIYGDGGDVSAGVLDGVCVDVGVWDGVWVGVGELVGVCVGVLDGVGVGVGGVKPDALIVICLKLS